VPHFQVVLGGEWEHNAGSYGLAIGAVPSKRIPETVERIATRYLAEKTPQETFQQYIKRIGKAAAKSMLRISWPCRPTTWTRLLCRLGGCSRIHHRRYWHR